MPEKLRFDGIDAPEMGRGRSRPGQPFAQRAKQYTSDLVFGKTVTVEPRRRDRYKRTIAVVKLSDGRVLNHEMVRAGLAWHFVKYAPKDDLLARLEREGARLDVGCGRMTARCRLGSGGSGQRRSRSPERRRIENP